MRPAAISIWNVGMKSCDTRTKAIRKFTGWALSPLITRAPEESSSLPEGTLRAAATETIPGCVRSCVRSGSNRWRMRLEVGRTTTCSRLKPRPLLRLKRSCW